MMRETRTLKGLFPDPKPPRRKNFIKENVKNLRRMEQLFHTNNKSAKDLKLPVLRQTKILNKRSGTADVQTNGSTENLQELKPEEIIENGIAKLLNEKSFHEEENKRKKSAPVLLSKKIPPKKLTRPSVNGTMIKKKHYYRDHVDRKTENRQKLKALSDEDVTYDKSNDNISNSNTNTKNQGVQTLDVKDINSIYSEGVIRYPSGRKIESQKPKLSDRGDTAQIYTESDVKNNSERSLHDSSDHLKSNKEHASLASKLASQLNNAAPPPSYRVGVVPKYIKERKEALQKEQLAKTAAKQSDCPRGHVPLPDNERKETLSMLKKNYQEYVSELNMLPIRTDTLRSQKRKMEIEKQLTKLEEAIKVFSRPKVFVKVDS